MDKVVDLRWMGCPVHKQTALRMMQACAYGDSVSFMLSPEASQSVIQALELAGFRCEMMDDTQTHKLIRVLKNESDS